MKICGLHVVALVLSFCHSLISRRQLPYHILTLLFLQLRKDSLKSQRLQALPASLLAFQDLVYPLEDSWIQSGLGHDYGISHVDIEKAATLHYNGVMKPWLDLGIHDYKSYWRKYMTNGEKFMTECNIH